MAEVVSDPRYDGRSLDMGPAINYVSLHKSGQRNENQLVINSLNCANAVSCLGLPNAIAIKDAPIRQWPNYRPTAK